MSNDPVDGGTVTYHRAEYDSGDDIWRVWFRERGCYYSFSGAEGEAMGLTPPEPAPLVVECRGHRIELSDLDADVFQRTWDARTTYDIAYDRACDKLAGLLRDARQDPQPTADTPSDDIDFDALPIGTVLTFNSDTLESTIVRQMGGWRNVANGSEDIPTDPTKWKIAYFPPPMSPGECLRALLAGRDDADIAIDDARRGFFPDDGPLLGVLRDAAREVHG